MRALEKAGVIVTDSPAKIGEEMLKVRWDFSFATRHSNVVTRPCKGCSGYIIEWLVIDFTMSCFDAAATYLSTAPNLPKISTSTQLEVLHLHPSPSRLTSASAVWSLQVCDGVPNAQHISSVNI